ncbi:MAG: SurA N-terminal domain-containing protein [Pseudomonadota bacterium]
MFEYIRNHRTLIQILMGLVILSFVLVGGNSAFKADNSDTDVADVGGKKITQRELDDEIRRQMEQSRARAGDRFDPKVFETNETKQAILENLISERALEAEIKKGHLTVGDAALQKQIGEIGAFKKPDGSFDMDQYKLALGNQGMTPQMFDARMRRDLALQQLNSAVGSTAFAPRSVATRLAEIVDQEREVQEQLFPATGFIAQVNVTDDMVKAYYDKNAAQFQVPEQLKVEYVVLDAAAVESQVSVDDAEVAAFYEKSKDSLTTPEQRFSSHIMINVKKDASAAEKAAAKAKAEAVLAEVRKTPANFAAIAKAQSQDVTSAEVGGDLGLAEKNGFASPEMEAAVFKMKQGEISDVLASDFGFHIVTVTKLVPAVVKTLDEAKPQIVAELKKQKMSKKYAELAELLTNTVYEQADSLKPAADKLKLQIQTADNLTRTPSPALGVAPVNNAKFLKAIFADDTLKNKRNTEAVEVVPGTFVAGRVVQYKPAAKKPLLDVAAAIRQTVTQEEAVKLAKKAGEATLAAVKASGDAAGFGDVKSVNRSKPSGLHPLVVAEVLKADVSKLPAYVGVEVPGAGYGIYRIGKVSQPEANPARRSAMIDEINGAMGQADMAGYIEALKAKAKTKLLKKPVVTADAK